MQVSEKTKMHNLQNGSKGDSMLGSLVWECGILLPRYHAPHCRLAIKVIAVSTMRTQINNCSPRRH